MSLPLPDSFLAGPPGPVHEPVVADHEPLTRRPIMFWDRVRLLVAIAAVLALSIAIKQQDVPIMPWGDVVRDQTYSKWWLFLAGGLEILHQVHLFICERSAGYNQFWEQRVWGAWERRMSRLNPWLRYRLGRMVKVVAWVTVALMIFARIWGVSFLEALVQAPGRLWTNPFGGAGMPWFFQLILAFGYIMFQFIGMFWFLSRGGIDTYMPRDIKTRFADVWGQDKVLEKVKENIVFLEHPESIEDKGGHVPGGMLLWGPPGTGKTLMAEAVAGETGKPYVFVDPGAFIQMFFGVGILKVKRLFTKLRKLALRYGGVIVFFDEADTLGSRGQLGGGFSGRADREELHLLARNRCCNALHYVSESTATMWMQDELAQLRAEAVADPAAGRFRANRFVNNPFVNNVVMGAGMGGGGGMGTLQALLTELSGLKKPRGMVSRRIRQALNMKPKQPPKYRILVMMATNMPEALDEALLRPGRIDRMYKVDYPNLEGRIKTFDGYLNKIRHVLTADQVERLAVMSPHASGAVIKDIVNESLIVAIRNGRDTVSWPDVLEAKAFKVHGLADGPASMELEQLQTALHEAGHAVSGYLLRRRLVIDIATIEQRGDVGGFVSYVPVEERKFRWRSELEHDIIVSLSSLAAERIFFEGDNSVGVGGDMQNATSMVRRMLSRSAMGDTLTSHMASDISDAQREAFDREVEAKLQELYTRAHQLMFDNRWFLAAIAHALQQHKTITGEDIDAIYRGMQGPTLDGAVYRTDGFLEQYGAYLTAAQQAHRAESPIGAMMPRYEPHPGGAYPAPDAFGPPLGYGGPPAAPGGFGPDAGAGTAPSEARQGGDHSPSSDPAPSSPPRPTLPSTGSGPLG